MKRKLIIAALLAPILATAAYAASSTLSNLTAGNAVSGTDIFYSVQTTGVGGRKISASQILTYILANLPIGSNSQKGIVGCDGTSTSCTNGIISAINGGGGGTGSVTSVAAGCGGITGAAAITSAGTISAGIAINTLTGANAPITSNYCGSLVNLNNGSSQTPTIAAAGSTGFGATWFVDICNIGAGTQTLTPASGTVGGASTLALSGGSAASPNCKRLISDGVSNYALR